MKKGSPYSIMLLLPVLLLALCRCSSDPDEPGGIDPPEQFTQRYNANQTLYSPELGQEIKYTVLLPQEYLSESDSRFGVVFLLHGWGGDHNSWGPLGLNIQKIVDATQHKPFIYVMPQGFNSYFCNRYDGKYNYMDMLTAELLPLIDKRFRTTAKPSERAVVGFSMGGFGALSLVSQHSDLFNVAVGLSPSLNTDEQYAGLSQDGWNLQWGSVFGGSGSTGQSRITGYYKSQCPLHFFADRPASAFQNINYYIDCGDDEERLYAGNGELHSLMNQKGIRHQYRVRNGGHTDAYWGESMAEVLTFIESSFEGKHYPDETTRKFDENIHSVSSKVAAGSSELELYLPSDYDPTSTYKVLYYSKGQGTAGLTARQVATALDSLMQIKKFTIASFDAQSVKQNHTSFAEICVAIEGVVHTVSDPDHRLGLIYGSDGDYLYEQASGADPTINYLFVEDADVGSIASQHNAKLYYLDITDDGSNDTSVFELFSALRAQESTVQYRVRNGVDSSASAMAGIYSMSYFISEPLIKKQHSAQAK